jgi:mersacidin/lichenicidin family type 2 lantibiotic
VHDRRDARPSVTSEVMAPELKGEASRGGRWASRRAPKRDRPEGGHMTTEQLIRTWSDREYSELLGDDRPGNPAGELADLDLELEAILTRPPSAGFTYPDTRDQCCGPDSSNASNCCITFYTGGVCCTSPAP